MTESVLAQDERPSAPVADGGDRKSRTQQLRPGFTLIEVLVSIGIIALLLALLVPAVQQARVAASRTGCRNQLHQIGLAMMNYESTHKLFPPGGVHNTTATPGTIPTGGRNDGRAPWTVLILPELDEANRYHAFDLNASFSSRSDLRSSTTEPNLTQQYLPLLKYTCPTGPNSNYHGLYSNYAACQGGGTVADAAATTPGNFPRLFYDNGIFFHNSSIKIADIKDGASNTVLVGETKYVGNPSSFAPKDAWWPWSAAVKGEDTLKTASLFNISATVDPINFPQNGEYTEADILEHQGTFEKSGHGGQQRIFGSWHPGGAHFLMADGSVRFLNENMDLEVYRSLGQRADGKATSF